LPVDRDDRAGCALRVLPGLRVHPGVRPRPDTESEQLRERLLHHDGLPRSPRARGSDPADPDLLPGVARPVLLAQPCRSGRGNPLLALRRRRVVLPVRHSLFGDHGILKKIAILVASVALLSVVAACGGSSPSQPAGSTKVSLTEFKFDPGTASPISVAHGKVVFWLVNTGNTSHDMQIKDSTLPWATLIGEAVPGSN